MTLNLAPHAVAVVALVLVASFASAQADLTVTAAWDPNCDPCTAGQRLTFVNTVTNQGPSPDPSVHIQMATAALGTTPVMDSWTTTQGEYTVDDEGNVLFTDASGLAYLLLAEMGVMTPNTTATLTYEVDLDMEAPPVSDVTVNSPADLAGPWEHRSASFGQPFYEWAATADLEWVDDGSALPQEGCGALVGFTPGNIALIDRGTCEFGLKALGAEAVGASAVIIVNNDPAQPLSGILMGAGDFGESVTLPVLMIHFDDGAILRSRMLPVGETVNASVRAISSVGPGEPWVVTPEDTGYPSMWAVSPTNDPTCPPDNVGCGPDNLVYTHINVTPGQVTEPVAGFTWTAAGLTATFTNTTTGTPPITYAWDFGDGGTSTDAAPTHVYAAAGTYTVTLTATNAAGSDTETQDVTVTDGGAVAPNAGFTWTAAGLTATFTNTTTGTPPITYAWDFGDGGNSTDAAPTHAYAAAGTYTVTLTATNAAGSDTETQDVTVTDGGAVAPNAGFGWSPVSPAVGATVTFTNSTTGTEPITYAWDFGDGATSTEIGPTHAYAAAGTFTVSLTATNSEGSDTETHDIVVTEEITLNEFYFVAAAANAEGAAGSFFVTDLEINNAGTTDMMYRFLWLPRDTDNSNPTASDVFTLADGASVRYENVLDEIFAAENVVGALAIVADSAEAIVMSRTYNQSDDGTFGQAIDGLHSTELIQSGERMRVVFMTETDPADVPTTGYRSNLGVLNGTDAPLTVMVARYDAEGTMLGDRLSVELDPWENTQLNRVLRNFDPPVAGYLDVWTETAAGAFAAYGSVLDNVTSDPTTVNPK